MQLKYTHKPKGNNTIAIYLALYAGGKVELISTGQRCPVKAWDFTDRLPKDHTSKLYKDIHKVKLAVEEVLERLNYEKKIVTPFTLKVAYNDSTKENTVTQVQREELTKTELVKVTTLIDDYLKMGTGTLRKSSVDTVSISLDTFKAYIAKHAPGLQRKELTFRFCMSYWHELNKLGYADATHGKKIKHLRWFLDYLEDFPGDIRKLKIKNPKPDERNIITLTREELTAIEELDLTGQSIEKIKARDLFLLGCYLGMRIGDMTELTPDDFKGGFLDRLQGKNRVRVVVPVLPECATILKRYKYFAPNLAEQKVNDWIKVICDDAGITERTTFKTVYDGELYKEVYPKNELISTHVACKTFITLSQDWDLTPVEIAALCGKSVKTVLGYYFKPDLKSAHKKMIAGANRAKMKVTKGGKNKVA